MKSIADGGLCHQFHYAGVVTKIISMIDETAARLHVEMASDVCNCATLTPSEIVLQTAETTDKTRRGLPLISRGRPTLQTAFITWFLGLHLQQGVIIIRKAHQTERPSRPGPGPVLYCVPNMPGGLCRPQLKQRTGEHDVSP